MTSAAAAAALRCWAGLGFSAGSWTRTTSTGSASIADINGSKRECLHLEGHEVPQDTEEVPSDPRMEDADLCEVLRELSGAFNWDNCFYSRV